MKLHFEGYGRDLDLCELLSDNYDTHLTFAYEDESSDIIPNVCLRIYESTKKCSLKQAENGFIKEMYGDIEATGQSYGYSEYTIEGFNVSSLTIGGHDIDKIIKNKKDKYLHILIETVKK